MRVLPFYSFLRGIGLERAWHDNSECPIGRSIAPADRVLGKGHLDKRCTYCTLLDSPVRQR